MNIDGNINATIQVRNTNGKNPIGEKERTWIPIGSVLGWLDYSSGQNDVNQFNAKIEETSHFFFCDYFRWVKATQGFDVTAENCRFVIDGEIYDCLLIDDPMKMHQHLEIYLQYVGGGLGVGSRI